VREGGDGEKEADLLSSPLLSRQGKGGRGESIKAGLPRRTAKATTQ
jgi:hypothetical protein